MADTTNSTPERLTNGRPASTSQSATVSASPSAIVAMQARYSKVWDDHNTTDQAFLGTNSGDNSNELLCKRGMAALENEADALRLAILYQIPTTMEEAAILSYHVWGLYDAETKLSASEKPALEAAVTAMFDFLMREGAADINAHGGSFRTATMLAWDSINYRSGQIEERA